MFDDRIDDDDDSEDWPGYEGKCQACDAYGPVDDMSMCFDCAGKLERDFIRQRHWDYSASAFGVSVELREQLRDEVIKEYGEALEILAPEPPKKKGGGSRRRRWKK